jgi:predicted metal-binding membrane protein
LSSITPAATETSQPSTGPTAESIDKSKQTLPQDARSHDSNETKSAIPSIADSPALSLRERVPLWVAIAALTALAWLYLLRMPMTPQDLGGFGARVLSALPARWADWPLTFLMWSVMMVAMMVPSAAPMVMTYARIANARSDHSTFRVWSFVFGYFAIWTLFSAAATAIQIALVYWSLLSNALVTTPLVSAAILVVAGVYQLTPLKEACLGRCQSPIGFFMTHWHEGNAGALRMGLEHGAFGSVANFDTWPRGRKLTGNNLPVRRP